MGWIIFLGILLVLGAIPLGIRVVYVDTGFLVTALAGPIRLRLFPQKKKPKPSEQPAPSPESEECAPSPASPPASAPEPQKAAAGGSWKDFLPLVKTALDFLGDFRRKLRIRHLECRLTLAGGDPCSLAVNYGRAWAALGNLLTLLEKSFVIGKRDVQVQCDFTSGETRITFQSDITITLGRLLALAVRYGVRAGIEYWKLRKIRKGGINHE